MPWRAFFSLLVTTLWIAQVFASDVAQQRTQGRAGQARGGVQPSSKAPAAQAPRRPAQAALTAPQGWVRGRVVVDRAVVYKEADFDSQMLGTARADRQFFLFPKTEGAFYKILISAGQFGYIADTEIRPDLPRTRATEAKKSTAKKQGAQKPKEEIKRKRAFTDAMFRGFSYAMINFREDTMGIRPTESLSFFGFKLSGPNILMEGSNGELNVQIAPSAPKYYEQATGVSSSGFVFLIDGLLQHTSSQGPNTMTYYGFGPMFKYSKFDTGLVVAGKTERYSLDDMTFGVALNLGIAQRVGDFALRMEAKYHWEQMQYLGFTFAVQKEF